MPGRGDQSFLPSLAEGFRVPGLFSKLWDIVTKALLMIKSYCDLKETGKWFILSYLLVIYLLENKVQLTLSWASWSIPIIPEFRRLKKEDCHKFQTNLDYSVSP